MKLLLDSLKIQNYRAFNDLSIEKLGRVNLFVGKNNVGKTSLLEALWVYSQMAAPWVLIDLLQNRNEDRDISRGTSNRRDLLKDWTLAILSGEAEKPLNVRP